MKTGIEPYVMECHQELGLTKDQLNDLKNKGDNEFFCFYACVFKKVGTVSIFSCDSV